MRRFVRWLRRLTQKLAATTPFKSRPLSKEHAELERQLLPLATAARVAFALSCAERMKVFYKRFREAEGWDQGNRLDQYLDQLWQMIESGGTLRDTIPSQMLADVYSLIPFSDKCGLNAVLCQTVPIIVHRALEVMLNESVQEAAQAGIDARNAVDQIAMDELFSGEAVAVELSLANTAASAHPVFVGEVAKQKADLALLARQGQLTPAFLTEFRKNAISPSPWGDTFREPR